MNQEKAVNLYGQVFKELGAWEQVAMVTVLGAEGQVEKHLYHPGQEDDMVEALAQKACHEGRPATGQVQGEPSDYGQAQGESGDHGPERSRIFVEPFTRESRMILLGGGHVSLALEEFAAKTGFAVTVVDDRPGFANRLRFPLAKDVRCQDFGQAIQELDIQPGDYIVLLTRGHRHDGDCLRALSEQNETIYLGMIGSRRRVRELKDQLAEEGIRRDWLESIHTPVGLDIGAVTPEEIAIAILAEVIMVKRKPAESGSVRVLQSDIDMAVIAELAQVPEKMRDLKRAVVTIMETKGSTPRKSGAKMIVYENGMVAGTIGGGCAEAGLMQHARQVIRDGGYKICHVDMTGTVAEDEGMVCGGIMQVLIEAE
ncbi:MAG: XdhC family protein [Eubacteriales bacterium]|nr:XdhC family protein [Eubacteriales bacterium]